MTKTCKMKRPADRRHARAGSSRTYPKLGRYEVRPPATTKPETNRRPVKKLKLGRYEVHVPEPAAPRPAQTLEPGELRPERTSHLSTPMLGPYEVHRPQHPSHQSTQMLGPYEVHHPRRTSHHQSAPTLGSSAVHQGGTLHHQRTPMLGPYEAHLTPTMHHTLPMTRSFPLQLGGTMPQTMPTLGSYTPVPPERNGMMYPSATDNRRHEVGVHTRSLTLDFKIITYFKQRTPHERRKPASQSSNRNRCRRKTSRRGKQSNATSQQLNTHHQKAFKDICQLSLNQFTADRACDAVSIFPESMPVHDVNNISKIEETTLPKAAPAAAAAPETKRGPTPEDYLMSDVLDIDILGPWTEEDERLYRADLIQL